MCTKHAHRDRDAVREQAEAEKGATRSSVMMSKRMPSGSTELKEMPRRPGYAEGAEGDAEWCKAVDAASAGYGKSNRAQSTANEHDLYGMSTKWSPTPLHCSRTARPRRRRREHSALIVFASRTVASQRPVTPRSGPPHIQQRQPYPPLEPSKPRKPHRPLQTARK